MGKFAKGQSGNPGGRPKEDPELKELARASSPEAIDRLVFWMRSDNAKASVTSCLAILDRAYGKPVQMTELSGPDGGPIETKDVSDMEVARRLAFILTKAVEPQDPQH